MGTTKIELNTELKEELGNSAKYRLSPFSQDFLHFGGFDELLHRTTPRTTMMALIIMAIIKIIGYSAQLLGLVLLNRDDPQNSTGWVRRCMNFLNYSIPRAQGRCLPPQLCTKLGHNSPHPLPPPQASEADSCFMGRPFSHSRPGSQPRDERVSACLSDTAGHRLCLPYHLLPHQWSELPGSWQRLQDVLDSLAKQASWGVRIDLPAQTRDVGVNKVRRCHPLIVCTKGLLVPFRLGKWVALKAGPKGSLAELILLPRSQVGVFEGELLVPLLSKFPLHLQNGFFGRSITVLCDMHFIHSTNIWGEPTMYQALF